MDQRSCGSGRIGSSHPLRNRFHPELGTFAPYPLPNTPGFGLGGLTNSYRRDETRTVDRKNYDVKVNFNRTTAHQLWAKYSFKDAEVDDLTNDLGLDPNAQGDGGFPRCTR